MKDDDLYHKVETVSELDSGETIALFVRGHVDLMQAKRVMLSYAKEEIFFEDDELENFGEPEHENWRKIPHPEHGTIFNRGFGRGSFPVTVMSCRDWSR